jgi:hypothetical protein
MRNIKTLFGISALAVAAATAFYIGATSANAASNCSSKAECACQVALDSGSPAAMRKYLQMFPRADTACKALNSTVRTPFIDNQGNNPNQTPDRPREIRTQVDK